MNKPITIASFLRRTVDWIFGYDFFISYSHSDGMQYPDLLRQRLQEKGFHVFLDQTGYVAGTNLQRETRRQVSKSTRIIVVGRKNSLKSIWVKREVDVALAANKTPVLIDINNSVDQAGPDAPLAELALQQDWLRLKEQLPFSDGIPSDHAILELVRGFDSTRQDTKRTNIFASAAVVLALISTVAIWQSIEATEAQQLAEQQRDRAENILEQGTLTADTLVFDLAQKLRNQSGMPQSLILQILEKAEYLAGKLAESGENSSNLSRTRAAALSELSTTYRLLGNSKQSIIYAEEALSIFKNLQNKFPNIIDRKIDLASAFDLLGDNLIEVDNWAAAEIAFNNGKDQAENAAEAARENWQAQQTLAVIIEKLGIIQLQKSNPIEAKSLFIKALKLRETASVEVKFSTDWRRSFAILLTLISDADLIMSEFDSTISTLKKSDEILKQLISESRSNLQLVRDHAVVLQKIGTAFLKVGRLEEAVGAFEKDLEIAKKLEQKDPSRVEWKVDLIRSYDRLGEAFHRMQQFSKSLLSFEQSYKLSSELGQRNSFRIDWYQLTFSAAQKVSLLALSTGDEKRAFEVAKENLAAEYALGAKVSEERLVDALNNLAWYAILSRNFLEALDATKKALAISPKNKLVIMNQAHALMFLKQSEEALLIYRKFFGVRVENGGYWEEIIKQDFEIFIKNDIYTDQVKEFIGKF